jgi:outer membrane protein
MPSTLRALCAATVLAVGASVPLASQAPAAPQRIMYIDSRAILDQAPGRAEAEAQLQKEADVLKAQLSKMNDTYVQMMSDFTKLPATTPQADRDKKLKAAQDKGVELQTKQQEAQDQYSQRQAELLQPILDQIKLVLEDIRVELSLAYVFDVSAQGGGIVAVDKNLNISDRVIAKLRTMPKPVIAAKSDSGKADPKKPVGAPANAPAGVARPGTTTVPPKKPDPSPGESAAA